MSAAPEIGRARTTLGPGGVRESGLAERSGRRTKLSAARPDFSAYDRPRLIVSIDAEEDFDWMADFSATSSAVPSMSRQHPAQEILERHGVVPIYLCDYPVAAQESAYSILREWRAAGRCAIGSQLHPWVNPPQVEETDRRNSYPCNLPLALQQEKLRILTETIEARIGVRPVVYKAGRCGADTALPSLLKPLGYAVDMSINPIRNYRAQGGPDHTRFPHEPFWFDAERTLLAIPLTCNVLGLLREHWLSLADVAWSGTAERMRLGAVLRHLNLINRVALTPEGVPLLEAKALTRFLLAAGHRVFSLSYHSTSLNPGSNPYVRDGAELQRFLAWLEDYLAFFLGEMGGVPALPTTVYAEARAAEDKSPPAATAAPRPPVLAARAPRGAPWIEATARPREIVVFDFLSHEQMHHAFNEGYVRMLRAAFPSDAISLYAGPGHVEMLASRVGDLGGVALRPCATFDLPLGFSRHNPIAGHWAARACLRQMSDIISGRPIRLAAILGVDANLYAVIGRQWPRHSAQPLHMVLHGHLGEAMVWRSRNPFIRRGDFLSQLIEPLPPQVRLIALEPGVAHSIAELFPAMARSLETLPHPVLPSEWTEPPPPRDDRLSIAFLGHARRNKGFPDFLELARRAARPDLDFQAIGLAATDTVDLDTSVLSRPPSPTALPRELYLACLAAIDAVCLPLHMRAYDFTASGTVCDAVAALKPLIALTSRTLAAMFEEYGPIGHLARSTGELVDYVARIDRAAFAAERLVWIENLRRMREARRPEALADGYSRLVLGSGERRRA